MPIFQSCRIIDNILALPVGRGKQNTNKQFVVISVLVHILLFVAIFDIYFTSPLLTNISNYHKPDIKSPPAQRLVLIVSDGLRAESLFKNNLAFTPFLRHVVTHRGAWGVSHTRVPTESRPGHVALIAGIYEDVASVTRGWQENAVEFDSVFNRSTTTWSWGSPDIVPMFARGAVPDRVHFHSYPSNMEDFSNQNTTVLDTWVFKQVTEFLKNVTMSPTLASKLRQQHGFVFFLHLLGMDTSGHTSKPNSKQYIDNIKVVDAGVKAIEQLFEQFFDSDGRTAYLFTSDHGMTDWGSHGAGLDFETMTPVIAWGSGFRSPVQLPSTSMNNPWSIVTQRVDVEQADLCPLMAAVLGLEFPVNSVGRLPLKYLNVSLYDQMQMARANAMQMLEQYRLKRRLVKEASLAAFFKEFDRLKPSVIESQLRDAASAHKDSYTARAIEIYQQLVDDSIEGLYYYHRYDRFFSGLCVSAIFLLWMICLVYSITPDVFIARNTMTNDEFSMKEHIMFGAIIFLQVIVLIAEMRAPVHWLYRLVPIYLLWSLYRYRHLLNTLSISFHGFLDGIVVVWGLELLIWSFFYRYLLSIVVILHCLWQLCSTKVGRQSQSSRIVFIVGSVILSIFPLFPVIGGSVNLPLVTGGSVVTSVIVFGLISNPFGHSRTRFQGDKVLFLQIILNLIACIVQYLCHVFIQKGYGLPLFLQGLSWLLLIVCILLTFYARRIFSIKYIVHSIWLSLTTIFTLLSIFYETLFLLALFTTISSWIVMKTEQKSTKVKKEFATWLEPFMPIQKEFELSIISPDKIKQSGVVDSNIFRHCFSYLTFLILSFFGTGNIASINSFDPQSVYCFLTIFQPFVMGALMMFKILLPMLLTSCLFLTIVPNVKISVLSRVTMVLADFMALHFFFLIRDWGSWLEIGTSISHYVISMAFTVVVALFLSISRFLLQRL